MHYQKILGRYLNMKYFVPIITQICGSFLHTKPGKTCKPLFCLILICEPYLPFCYFINYAKVCFSFSYQIYNRTLFGIDERTILLYFFIA